MMRTVSTVSYSKWLLYTRISPQALRRKRSRGSVVCVATGCGVDILNPGRGKFSSFSGLTERFSSPPNLLCFSGINAADEWSWLPPSSAKVKNDWSYTSISPTECSWDRASQFSVNKCPTRCINTQFILSLNCSTCFVWYLHPSSEAQITVSTASGTSQPFLFLTPSRYRPVATTVDQCQML